MYFSKSFGYAIRGNLYVALSGNENRKIHEKIKKCRKGIGAVISGAMIADLMYRDNAELIQSISISHHWGENKILLATDELRHG